ncbi:PfaD family polyunsaturated fatty acid/polyketide biosynthesis protein [Vulgatibacter sp.]|uniref:PfaD family polyunsaturated fatty acid/polyketide biosynthesis protein n=1 Tax=Vulgatibacter sp. TaxID=1971226 RepID=UPI00356645DB
MVGKQRLARHALGAWTPGVTQPRTGTGALRTALERLGAPLCVVDVGGRPAVAEGGAARPGAVAGGDALPLLGYVPALLPEQLGDAAFREAHGLRYAYVAGEMANGIASVEMVEAVARAGMLGFFGAAGLPPQRVEAALVQLRERLGDRPWGANLIHSPSDPALEAAHTELFLRHGVRLASASAYLDLTAHVVRYRVHGIHRAADGTVVTPNRLVAKVSRTEVARKFLAPPPAHLLRELVARGQITEEQARLAESIPMAEDVTAEADSGGHTDNRPLVVILPAIQAVRDELQEKHRYAVRPRVGAAGGIATPAAAAAAFSLGAAYVITGSVNQGCREAGTSDLVRQLLAEAGTTDVAMAPAADMFELGVEVQVLSRGTIFPVRAQKLYELYRAHESVESLPTAVRAELEKKYFRCTLEEAWEGCKAFFAERDPAQIDKAAQDPKHKLGLIFRSYLGRSSGWANEGVADRRLDFQVWCGPAMGAFNEWARGSFLEKWEARQVVPVARNLLAGAAFLARVAALRAQGLALPAELERFAPREAEALDAMCAPAPAPVQQQQPATPARESGERKEDAIAIVGMAALFPKAQDLASFWRNIRTGVDTVGEIPATHWSLADYHDPDPKAPDRTYANGGAFLDPTPFDPTEFGIPPSILEATDTSQLLGLVVARQALEDAGLGEGAAWDRSRASVLLGVTGTQELVISLGARLGHPHWKRALDEAGVPADQAADVIERIGRAYVGWQENSFPGLLGNVVAGRIANRFDFGGTNSVIDAACASSLGAVHMACMELQTGKADVVLTGGVDTLNDIFMHMCFSKTPALSPTGHARPFSAQADGTVLGEGLGMLVLKRLSDAERDGDRIHAVIRGIGTASDGRAKSIYAPLPSGQARALRDAYRTAGVSPRSIGLLEAHGTGTKAGDACEFEALETVYAEASDERGWCALGSVKSQIGHTKAAAGAAGLIKAALALANKVLPPTIKADEPNPAMRIAESPFHLATEVRPWIRGETPRRAAVSAFGFGGSNFHAVLEEYRAERTAPIWDGAAEIVAFSGAHAAALAAGLDELAAIETPALRTFAARSRARFSSAAAHRLVLVLEAGADRPRRIEAARALLAKGPGHLAEGVHYGTGAVGRLAFLFPGQGSQRVGMLRDLTCAFPEMLEAVEAAGAVAQAIYPAPSSDPDVRKAQQAALTATDVAQPALGAVEGGLLGLLGRFGVRPDLVAGHSYGELVALHAAGVLDAEGLRRVSALRGRLMAGDGGDRGTMLAVHAPLAALDALIAEEKLDVVLANRNAPAQGVLSGSRAAIDRAEAACKARGLRASRLPVGAAFHSALVADAAAAFRAGLAEVSFGAAALPVFANTTGGAYPAAPEAMRELLGNQLAAPVRFVELVESLHAAGATTFLEVGPRTVLGGLVRAILGERPHHAIAVDASQGQRDGLVDLAHALAALAARGHEVRLEAWENRQQPPRSGAAPRRQMRMNVPLTGANHRAPQPPLPRKERQAPREIPAQPEPPARTPEMPMSQPTDPQSTALLLEALRANGETLRALQLLQEQTALVHQRFLEGQVAAQQSFAALLGAQQQLVTQAVGGPVPMPMPMPVIQPMQPMQLPTLPVAAAPAPAFVQQPIPATAFVQQPVPAPAPVHAAHANGYAAAAQQNGHAPGNGVSHANGVQHHAPAPAPRPAAPAPVANTAVAAGKDVVAELLAVVSEATGYPQEMLELDMDLESDLGIDSIKRVEILSLLGKRIPDAPAVDPEKLGNLRTLRQVAAFVGGGDAKPAPAPAVAAAAQPGDAQGVLLAVVSELTGYPEEMLDLEMDLEADLGIDSIKRVEILSLLGKRLPDAPAVDPEKLSGLRTLRQVLEFCAPRERGARAATATSAAEPAPDAQRASLLRREVVASRLGEGAPRALPQGPIAITDDGDGLAGALAAHLVAQGADAKVLPLGAATDCAALVICAGPDWTEARLADAFAQVRAAAPTLREKRGLLATVARRDGGFGRLDASAGNPAHGGLAGLAKTAAREWPEVACRALDLHAHLAPAEAAALLAAELRSEGPEEVGLGPAGRVGLALAAAEQPQATDRIRPGELVVVTGGARGVTAACAVELAKARRPTLLLLGRSPLEAAEPAWLAGADDEAAIQRALLAHRFTGTRPTPLQLRKACAEVLAQREIRSTLAAIEAAGATALYRAVDTRDAAALAQILEGTRRTHGPVRGVVHGAGVLRDKRIEEKSDEDFAAVFSTKVDGLKALLAASAGDDLAFLALFTSVSGRFGRRGQVDYAMANETLTALALAESDRRPGCRVVALDWGPWEGGMVTPALAKEFAREGIALIPVQAGAALLAGEVCAAPGGAVELVIGAGFPGGSAPEVPEKRIAAAVRVDPVTHRYLADHQLAGKPVLPVVMQIEFLAAAAARAVPGGVVLAVEDFRLLKGVIVEGPVDLTVWLAAPTNGRIEAELRGAGDRIHARCTVVLGAGAPLAPLVEPQSLAPAPYDAEAIYAERQLFHGPRFHAIAAVDGIGAKAIATTLHTKAIDWIEGATFTTAPLALDGVFQALVLWCRAHLGAPSLPSRLGAWRQRALPLPAQVRAVARVRAIEGSTAVADVDLLDESGAVVAQVEGYACTASASLEAAYGSAAA